MKFLLGTLLGMVLLGCASKSPNPTTNTTPPTNKPANTSKKQAPSNQAEASGKTISYPNCHIHQKATKSAYEYIINEFKKAYFDPKDISGAKAQLFLITMDSQTSFAKNINKAQKTYNEHYNLAKENDCPLSSFPSSPIGFIEEKIKTLNP